MAKAHQDAFAAALAAPLPTTAAPSPAPSETATLERGDVIAPKRDSSKSRSHVSLYVSPAVQEAVKRLALDGIDGKSFKRPHDVYVAALRSFLTPLGIDFDKLQGTSG